MTSQSSFVWPMLSSQNGVQDRLENDKAQVNTNVIATTSPDYLSPPPASHQDDAKSTHFIAQNGVNSEAVRPKVRGKLSPQQRLGYQQTRRLGACIRCRILRKPCGGEDPCVPCRVLTKARVWTHGCIRTKLPDELKDFFVGLHSVTAHEEVAALKGQAIHSTQHSAKIEALSFSDIEVMITIASLQLSHDLGNGDSVTVLSEVDELLTSSRTLFVIDMSFNDIASCLEAFVKSLQDRFIELETTRHISACCTAAVQLLKNDKDPLLEKSLTLWTYVLALLQVTTWRVSIHTSPTSGSMDQTSSAGILNSNETGSPATIVVDPDVGNTHNHIIVTQIRAAIEKIVHELGRAIVAELDSRLFDRHLTGKLNIFLASIIFCNSLERLVCFYYTYLDVSKTHQWTGDKSPTECAAQAEHFSNMVLSIAKMRYIPPSITVQHATGMLIPADEEEHNAVSTLLRHLNFMYSDLAEPLNCSFDAADFRSLDGQYSWRILQACIE